MFKVLSTVLALTLLAGCSQFERSDEAVNTSENNVATATAEEEVNSSVTVDKNVPSEIPDTAVQSFRKMIESSEKAINENLEGSDEVEKYRFKKVKFWFNYFTKRDPARFQRFLNRGQKYREVVQTTLEENEIPNELYYMAMIESGYSTHAHSHASAVGVWQFIRATGQRYGLKSNYYIDERRHPILATEGATKYLRDLYNAFLSWELAMAAYNTGELRVFRAIMAGKTRNYWVMSMQKRLPRETRNYVPKFIAATIIGRNPEKYGFVDPAQDFTPYPSVVAVEVPPRVRIRDIANISGIDKSTLKELNPHIRRNVTPPIRGKYEIWVPEEKLVALQSSFDDLSKKQISMRLIDDSSSTNYYVVRRRDTLSHIASRHRMSTRTLKRINNLRTSRIYPGMKLRTSTRTYHRPSSGGNIYVVRAGDSLGVIARRYNTSISSLKRNNNLRSSRIKVGQRLVVSKAASRNSASTSNFKHRVRRGETLEKIARKYGLSIRRLKRINGLRRNTIYVGELLKVAKN